MEAENKIGLCAPNKILIAFDGQIGASYIGTNGERPLFALSQLKRKVGPAEGENLLTDEDFPDFHSDETPGVLFYFETSKSIDIFIKMLEHYKQKCFEE